MFPLSARDTARSASTEWSTPRRHHTGVDIAGTAVVDTADGVAICVVPARLRKAVRNVGAARHAWLTLPDPASVPGRGATGRPPRGPGPGPRWLIPTTHAPRTTRTHCTQDEETRTV